MKQIFYIPSIDKSNFMSYSYLRQETTQFTSTSCYSFSKGVTYMTNKEMLIEIILDHPELCEEIAAIVKRLKEPQAPRPSNQK